MSLADLVSIIWGIPGVSTGILLGFAVATALVPPLARRLGGRGPAMLAWLTIASWGVVLTVTLVPDTRWLGVTNIGPIRSMAGANVESCVTNWDHAVPLALRTLDGQANILLFAAPALFATLWTGRPYRVGLILSLQSAAIEIFQGAVAGTSCQASDWISNTLGSVVGAALGAGLATAVPPVWRRAAEITMSRRSH